MCDGCRLRVRIDEQLPMQSLGEGVGFGWQAAAPTPARPEPVVAMPCTRTSIQGWACPTIPANVPAAVTYPASGGALRGSLADGRTLRCPQNQNAGEGVSDHGPSAPPS